MFDHLAVVKAQAEGGFVVTFPDVPADAQWSPLESWPRGTDLRLEGLGLSLGWDEVYAGVGLR